MATTTTTSGTTSNCSGFFNLRSTNVEHKVARLSIRGSPPAACGKLDGVAVWFINGMVTVFFASLERCSCIRIATEDDGEEANYVPLIHNDGNMRHDDGSSSRRRKRKGKKGGDQGAFLED